MSSARPPLPPLQDDGLPTLPTGEPVLHRWFVIAMLVLAPLAVATTIWAMVGVDRTDLTAAQRRPPGDGAVTIERGDATLSETQEVEPGPDCAQAIRLVGDSGSRAAARRAMVVTCELIATGDFSDARSGLIDWIASDGRLRIATFELSGVESSARVEDRRIVIELNAAFQFDDALRAAPELVHQLNLVASAEWPGGPVTAETALDAARAQVAACRRLELGDQPPRGCTDADELLAADDPLKDLVEAGYPRAGEPGRGR